MNKLKLIIVMLLWGSIGLFTRFIPLSPIQLAFCRSIISLPILFILIPNKKVFTKLNKRSLLLYALSGALIGLAWVTLFYGYKNTTIASAVIIYNMCPVYVMLIAPLILDEKRSLIQSIVIGISFLGLVLIVGTSQGNKEGDIFGMLMSGISGVLYAVIVIINRKIKVKIESNTATFIQMSAASLLLMPFIASKGMITDMISIDIIAIVLTVILAWFHTGFAFSLYFSTYHHMKSIDIVTFSYFEPLFGIMFGVILLGEKLSLLQWLGAVLILGSTFVGENIKARKIRQPSSY